MTKTIIKTEPSTSYIGKQTIFSEFLLKISIFSPPFTERVYLNTAFTVPFEFNNGDGK